MLYRRFPGKKLDEIAKEIAKGYEQGLSGFKKPAAIRKEIDLGAEDHRMVMELNYKGRKTFLRTYIDNFFWPQETQVAAAFKRLLQAKMPEVTYLTGNLERSIYKAGEREYSGHSTNKQSRSSLINNGFDLDTLNLKTMEIPAEVKMLVLADPKTKFSDSSLHKLKQYIDRGGNLLIAGEPGKQEVINPLLSYAGLRMMDGTLVQVSMHYSPDMVTPYLTREATSLAEQPLLINLKTRWDTVNALMPGVAPLLQTDSSRFQMEPIFMTDKNVWLKPGKLVTDSAAPVFNAAAGDSKSDGFTTAMKLTRKVNGKEQRIVVCGDADFMANNRMRSNLGIEQAFYSWMDNNEFPIYAHYSPPADDKLNISYQGAVLQKTIFLWIVPIILLLTSTVLLIRRKRQ
jgi:ABC-2 type transport system permease protein